MKKSSLLQIISTFSKKDISRFEDFVKSPYHNKNSNAVKLFLVIKKYSDKHSDNLFTKEWAWKKAFPAKKYNYGIMKNLIHDLTKLAEQFIVTENTGKRKLRNYFELLDGLMKRNAKPVITGKLASLNKITKTFFLHDQSESIEGDFSSLSDIFCQKLYVHLSLRERTRYFEERGIAVRYMVYSFIINMLRLQNNINVLREGDKIAHQKDNKNAIEIFLENFGERGFKDMLDYAQKTSEDDYKIMNCYYMMYKSFSLTNSISNYYGFKNAFTELKGSLPHNSVFDLFVNLENSLAKQKLSPQDSSKETIEINDFMINNYSLLGSEGLVLPMSFTRYMLSAFVLKKTDKIKSITDRYLKNLPAEFYKFCLSISEALIHFLDGNYQKSLALISSVSSHVASINLLAKEIKIMIYYEINDFESLLYITDTHKHFINYKNKPNHISSHNNFGKLVLKLFKLKKDFNYTGLQQLKGAQTKGIFTSINWFNEKIEELEKLHNVSK